MGQDRDLAEGDAGIARWDLAVAEQFHPEAFLATLLLVRLVEAELKDSQYYCQSRFLEWQPNMAVAV